MKHQKSFYTGMLTTFALFVTGVVVWCALQLSVVMPIVNANPASANYVAPSAQKTANAAKTFERLYHLSKFLGLDTYASRAIGSAGKALSLREDKASHLQAKYYYLKSIEEADLVARSEGAFKVPKDRIDPLLEAYLEYSRFLTQSGQRSLAKKTLKRAQRLAKKSQTKSAHMKDIQQAIHKINRKRI